MDQHKNLAYTLVATAPSPASSGTSLVVTAGQGSRFPTAPFNATVWAIGEVPTPSNAEIVRVTAVVGDTLTITRAQETTSARTIVVGDQIAATVTVKTFTDIETAFAGTASAITNGSLTVNTSGISINIPAAVVAAGTNGAITGGSITVNTSGVSINLPAYLTTADLSQNSSKYAGTNGAITGGSITVNTSGVSVNLPAYLTTAALSNHSHGNPTLALTNLTGTTASNSAGLTLSLSGNVAQTPQTQNVHNVTLAGNTAGALAQISSGTWTLAGGNNITLSQAGNAVTISGAAAGGAQTGISGIQVSDATFTSGTVTFRNLNGISFGSSGANGISASYTVPTVPAQFSGGFSTAGNTSGNTGLVTGRVNWVGGNNITLSGSTNAGSMTITISGAAAGGAQTAISGVVVSDTTYTSGTVSFSNQANITIGSSVNGATQYIRLSGNAAQTTQTQNLHNVTLSGNTAGAMAQVSSGTLTLAGGNNITLSQAGNAITISGAAAGGAQTAISGIVVSDTTYTSGTVSFSNVGGITISSSVNAGTQYIRLSVASQTVQTQNVQMVTLSGNTSGALAGLSSGTVTLAGGNGITLSQAGNAVTVSGATYDTFGSATTVAAVGSANAVGTASRWALENHVHAGLAALGISTGNTSGTSGSVQGTYWIAGGNNITVSQITSNNGSHTLVLSGAAAGGAQTAISGIVVSDTTYTSGTVSFSNQANITIGSSVNGATQYIRLSGNAAQTVQTQNLHNLTISGNTAGALAAISSGTLTLAGGNNITLSQAGNAITISGAAAGGAQTAISGVIVSDATYTSGTISFSNAGNITISSSVNGASQYVRLSVAAQTVQTQNLHNVTISGNTSGALAAISSGTLTIAGGNNITISQAGNAITISGPTFLTFDTATTVTPVGSANSVGTSPRWVAEDHVHAGIGALGISTQGNTAGTTGSVQGSYWFRGTNNITVSQITSNNGSHTLVISGPSVGGAQTGISGIVASDTTYTSGTVSFSNQANITIGSSVNGATQYIRLSGNAAQTVQTQNLHNLTISGNTAGALAAISSGTLTLAGGNNITLSQAGNAITISGAAAGGAQTGISGIVVSDATYTSGTVSFSNAGNITISSSVNGATQFIRLSGHAAQTNQSAIEGFGVSNTGNTAGNTGISSGVDWVLGGSGQLTLSQSTAAGTNTIWIQHPSWLSTQSTQFLALTLGGNTAGTTTFHATNNVSLHLHGGNNITLSGNGSTVTIVGGAGGGGLTNIRVSAGTTSNLLSDVTFADSNGISFGISASTITANVNTVGTATTVYPVATANSVGTVTRWAAEDHRHAGALPDLQFFDNGGVAATTLSNPGNATLYLFPLTPINEVFPGNMSVSSVFLNVTHSLSTAATFTNTISLAFYSSVNSTQLTRVFSASSTFGTNAGNMNINDSFGGTRWLSIHSSQFDAAPNFSAGVRYWCALWNRTTAPAGSLSLSFYGYQTLGNSAVRSGVMGVGSVNNTTRGWGRFNGIYSATFATAMPAALAASDINKGVVQVAFMPQVIFNNVGTDIV